MEENIEVREEINYKIEQSRSKGDQCSDKRQRMPTKLKERAKMDDFLK